MSREVFVSVALKTLILSHLYVFLTLGGVYLYITIHEHYHQDQYEQQNLIPYSTR